MPKTVDHVQRRKDLAAAVWRIVDRGRLEEVTVRQVAAEAGVSVGQVQHYFKTKGDLLQFAVDQINDEGLTRVRRRVASLPPPPDPLVVLRIVMHERLPFTRRQRVQGQVVLAWLIRIGDQPQFQDGVVAGQRTLCSFIADQLNAGQAAGCVARDLDVETAAFGLLAINEGLCAGLLNGLHTPARARRILDAHLDTLIRPAGA